MGHVQHSELVGTGLALGLALVGVEGTRWTRRRTWRGRQADAYRARTCAGPPRRPPRVQGPSSPTPCRRRRRRRRPLAPPSRSRQPWRCVGCAVLALPSSSVVTVCRSGAAAVVAVCCLGRGRAWLRDSHEQLRSQCCVSRVAQRIRQRMNQAGSIWAALGRYSGKTGGPMNCKRH